MKVNNKILKRFLEIMENYGEFVFGEEKDIKKQLELCLNTQGYWSGSTIRVYYNKEKDYFCVENRF